MSKVADHKITAIIPARGGSKGLPGKNIKEFCGQPLFVHAANACKLSRFNMQIVVSTDSDDIQNICLINHIRAIRRPSAISGDDALVIDAAIHVLDSLQCEEQGSDIVLLLEPTSPLRSAEIIDSCVEKLINNERVDSVATFSPLDVPVERVWIIEDGMPRTFLKEVNPWLPRQTLTTGFKLNGLVYAVRVNYLRDERKFVAENTIAVITDPIRSIDIDDLLTFKFAELVARESAK